MTRQNNAIIEELLTRGIAEAIDREHLKISMLSGKKLRLKLGIDPTGAMLHLGHAVPLRIMRRFQDIGHTVVLIVGDFTASIGDPSGKNETRPPLTTREIKENYTTYEQQALKILDPKLTEVRWQTEWYGKFGLHELLREASKLSAGWILSHETFRARMKTGRALALHELLYPLLQAYDSIVVKPDIEFGGLDQKFNLLTGRELMKAHGMEPQDAMLTKYLVGTDGQKMGKSLDNYIALEEEPFEMFGKIMRMSDTVLREFYELATDVPMIEVDTMKFTDVAARDAKLRLAQEIVTLYHSKKTAQLAMGRWENTFVRDVAITDKARIVKNDLLEKNLRDMVVGMGLAKSKSETQRLFEQGGVLLDGVVEKNWRLSVVSFSKGNHTLTVGKKKQVITFTV